MSLLATSTGGSSAVLCMFFLELNLNDDLFQIFDPSMKKKKKKKKTTFDLDSALSGGTQQTEATQSKGIIGTIPSHNI